MTPEALEALKGSIEKWRRIVEEGGEDEGADNCPLCALFHDDACDGCPVADAVNDTCCDSTPYGDWIMATRERPRKVKTEEHRKAAIAELEFLRSLLPASAE